VCAELSALAVPAWVSVTCSGRRTRAGESAADAFDIAAACPAVIAVGVNCTDPADVGALVPLAARSGKPVVIYPNSGESWDAKQRRWVGPGRFASEDVRSWVDAGARLVGGCCRVRPEDIAALAAEVGPPPSGRSSSTA
jgi:homocysteine S-methyltransferase